MSCGKIRNLYPGGNTIQGFYSFYDSVMQGLDRLFILKGGPGTGKSTLMRQVGLAMVHRGYDAEFLHCSSDNHSLDGVIIPALKLGLVDGTSPHMMDPKYPGAVDEIVNLGECWNGQYLRDNRQAIMEYTNSISGHFAEAYNILQQAKEIKREWEDLIGPAMDYAQVEQKTNELIEDLFTLNPRIRHQFAGAITPEGAVNFLQNLSEDCERRIILRGAPGSGRSTLIHKVAQTAVAKGYGIELYHCAFDPDKVDMVIIPYLKIAVLDGSPPHFFVPQRPGDQVLNLMDFAHAEVLNEVKETLAEKEKAFNAVLETAVGEIKQAKNLHDKLETYYVDAMDFDEVEGVQEQVLNKVLEIAADQKNHESNRSG